MPYVVAAGCLSYPNSRASAWRAYASAGATIGTGKGTAEHFRRVLAAPFNPALAALVAAVKKAGISPARFAGGHASTADYAPLAAPEGK